MNSNELKKITNLGRHISFLLKGKKVIFTSQRTKVYIDTKEILYIRADRRSKYIFLKKPAKLLDGGGEFKYALKVNLSWHELKNKMNPFLRRISDKYSLTIHSYKHLIQPEIGTLKQNIDDDLLHKLLSENDNCYPNQWKITEKFTVSPLKSIISNMDLSQAIEYHKGRNDFL